MGLRVVRHERQHLEYRQLQPALDWVDCSGTHDERTLSRRDTFQRTQSCGSPHCAIAVCHRHAGAHRLLGFAAAGDDDGGRHPRDHAAAPEPRGQPTGAHPQLAVGPGALGRRSRRRRAGAT